MRPARSALALVVHGVDEMAALGPCVASVEMTRDGDAIVELRSILGRVRAGVVGRGRCSHELHVSQFLAQLFAGLKCKAMQVSEDANHES